MKGVSPGGRWRVALLLKLKGELEVGLLVGRRSGEEVRVVDAHLHVHGWIPPAALVGRYGREGGLLAGSRATRRCGGTESTVERRVERRAGYSVAQAIHLQTLRASKEFINGGEVEDQMVRIGHQSFAGRAGEWRRQGLA
jgi:hypothetical protein